LHQMTPEQIADPGRGCSREKKERSGLQSACDELIDKVQSSLGK
jgi:hypothetical protein